jgi:hypothetical protein
MSDKPKIDPATIAEIKAIKEGQIKSGQIIRK